MLNDLGGNNLPVVNFSLYKKEVSLNGYASDDWIFRNIAKHKSFYELDLLKYIRYVLRGNQGGIIDIGANIGNHAVFFGLYVGRAVMCFEPNPDILPILKRNLSHNNIIHRLYECGLGDSEKLFDIQLPSEYTDNIGAARLTASDKPKSPVQVKKLDSYANEIEEFFEGKLKAIKIDVEGMEEEVLNGAKQTIQKYKPELFVEIASEHNMQHLKPLIRELGYYPVASYAATPVWHFTPSSRFTFLKVFKLKLYSIISKLLSMMKIKISTLRNTQ